MNPHEDRTAMTTPPEFSITARKMTRIALLAVMVPIFLVMALHHKAFINVEEFGIPENYLYYGGLALVLVGVAVNFAIWRCPGCQTYLGNKAVPTSCIACGAEFR
jgi:hypothetical protein